MAEMETDKALVEVPSPWTETVRPCRLASSRVSRAACPPILVVSMEKRFDRLHMCESSIGVVKSNMT